MEKVNKIIEKIKNKEKTEISNIDNWKEFKLNELFEIEEMSEKEKSNGNKKGKIPLIIAKKDNNGVGNFIKNGKKLFSKNKIFIIKTGDGGAGLSFYQGEDFYAVSSVMILKENNKKFKWKLNKYIGLFLITCMKKFKKEFSHSNSINDEKFNNLIFSLPAKNNEPDLEYMENFIIDLKKNIKCF